jgi:hypothetical protein
MKVPVTCAIALAGVLAFDQTLEQKQMSAPPTFVLELLHTHQEAPTTPTVDSLAPMVATVTARPVQLPPCIIIAEQLEGSAFRVGPRKKSQ